MKAKFTSLVLGLLMVLLPIVKAENCSCTSPDKSCSTSISCPGGCGSFCANNGGCVSFCSGRGHDLPLPEDLVVTLQGYVLGKKLSANFQQQTTASITEQLSKMSGLEISFTPNDPNALVSFDLKEVSTHEALKFLANFGNLKIAGMEFEKLESLRNTISRSPNEKFSLHVKNVATNFMLPLLSYVSNRQIALDFSALDKRISLSNDSISLIDVLRNISDQTNSRITITGTDSAQ